MSNSQKLSQSIQNYTQYNTSGVKRFMLGSDGAAESTGNAGSNFIINRYDDTGALLGTSVTISRSTGTITANAASITIDNSSASAGASFIITSIAGTQKEVTYQVNGLNRWKLVTNNSAESGSNIGSDFGINRFSDAGSLLDTPLYIQRSTGNIGVNNTSLPAWNTAARVIQIGTTVSFANSSNYLNLSNNCYYDSSPAWKYINTAAACTYQQTAAGAHSFYTAASGTAGTAITWNTALTIDSTGLTLGNATSNMIIYGTNGGIAPPAFTTRSAGTKIVLNGAISGTAVDHAIGIESNNTWFSTPTAASHGFKWYGGTTLAATLTGAGALTLVGDFSTSGNISNSLTSATASRQLVIRNWSNNAAAYTIFDMGNDVGGNEFEIALLSSTNASYGVAANGGCAVHTQRGLQIGSAGAYSVAIKTSNTERLTINSSGAITCTSTLSATALTSTIATGTAPLTVSSTTKVTNLNCDYLDGLDSGSFLRSDAGTTWNGGASGPFYVQVPSTTLGSTAGSVNTLQVQQASATGDAFMTFHNSGAYAVHFGLDRSTNHLFVGGWSMGAVKYKIWTSGNDGAGSGLDADLLDGLSPDTAATASTHATRDASANLTCASYYASNWFRSTGATGWYSETYAGGIYMTDTTWVRVYNSKAFYVANDIAATGNVTAYYSDMRLKTKINDIDNAISKVKSLNGFYYINNDTANELGYTDKKMQVGVSAQEVQAVMPEVVSLAPVDMETLEDGTIISKSGQNYMTVDYSRLVPLLIEAIKEQQVEIDALKAKVGVL